MIDTEHLDRVERFANWLETRRREAGLTQKELAAAAGISNSYYSKLAHIGQLRRTYGDGSREVVAPRALKSFEGVLRVLGERLGNGTEQEGREVWSGLKVVHQEVGIVNTQEKERLVGDTVAKMLLLPDDKLRLVAEIVSKLT